MSLYLTGIYSSGAHVEYTLDDWPSLLEHNNRPNTLNKVTQIWLYDLTVGVPDKVLVWEDK